MICYAEQYNQTKPAGGKSGTSSICVATSAGLSIGDNKMSTLICARCKTEYILRADGQEFEVNRKHYIKCCDCGLVHLLRFRIKKGRLFITAFRDNRKTGQARRWLKKQDAKTN